MYGQTDVSSPYLPSICLDFLSIATQSSGVTLTFLAYTIYLFLLQFESISPTSNMFCVMCRTLLPNHTNKCPTICIFSCDQCKFVSPYKSHLSRHIESHRKKWSYKCKDCNYVPSTRSDKKRHSQVYHQFKEMNCTQPECYFRTLNAKDLREHLLTHSGEKPHKCKQCSFSSIYMKNLTSHMKIHSSEKSYTCNTLTCSYATSIASNLRRHMIVHNSEKVPIKINKSESTNKCNLCDYASEYVDNFKRHMQKHKSGSIHKPAPQIKRLKEQAKAETVYVGKGMRLCKACDKKGKSTTILAHAETHCLIKLPCDLCDKWLVSTYAMKRHKVKVHAI